jgi:magnesium transporter
VGGNAGTQTLAITVRALATNQLTQSNTRRTILREVRVAALNGITIALIAGSAAALFFGNPMLGLVIGSALVFNVLVAGLVGVIIPITLDHLDQDPAVASSIFVTMITDSMGFFAFLGLAVASGLVNMV